MAGFNYYQGVQGGQQGQGSPFGGGQQSPWGMGGGAPQSPYAGGNGYQQGQYMGAGLSGNGGFGSQQGPGYQGGQNSTQQQGGQTSVPSAPSSPGAPAAAAQSASSPVGSVGSAYTPYATTPVQNGTAPAQVAPPGTTTPNTQNPNWAGFYLPSNAPGYLVNNQLPGNSAALNSSIQSGNGHIADADIPYLDAAGANKANPFYTSFTEMGLDPTVAGQMQKAGYNPYNQQQVGAYYQQQSINGPQAGVNYSFNPQFGLMGQVGDLNFDVARLNPGAGNAQQYANYISQYLQPSQGGFGAVTPQIQQAYMQAQQTPVSPFQYYQGPTQFPGGPQNSYLTPGGTGMPSVNSNFGSGLWDQ